MLGWAPYAFHKKCSGTHYTEVAFLHRVGSTCHKVHSGAFGARNDDALVFLLGWVQRGFHKKRIRTRYADLVFLHPVGSVGHVVHFGTSGA
jgi:hypothetical protein